MNTNSDSAFSSTDRRPRPSLLFDMLYCTVVLRTGNSKYIPVKYCVECVPDTVIVVLNTGAKELYS